MREIELVNGGVALVDDEDYERLVKCRWSQQSEYAVRGARKGEHSRMHRLLMDAPPGTHVHHIDGDGLNNQRANLCIVTPSEHPKRHREDGLPNQFHLKKQRGRPKSMVKIHDIPFDWAAVDRDYRSRGL